MNKVKWLGGFGIFLGLTVSVILLRGLIWNPPDDGGERKNGRPRLGDEGKGQQPIGAPLRARPQAHSALVEKLKIPSGSIRHHVSEAIHSLAYSPDSELIASAAQIKGTGKASIVIWNVRERREATTFEVDDVGPHLSFSDDSNTLFVRTVEREILYFDRKGQKNREKFQSKFNGSRIDNFALSRNATIVAIAEQNGNQFDISIWNVRENKEIKKKKCNIAFPSNMEFSADGTRLVIGGTNTICVLSVPDLVQIAFRDDAAKSGGILRLAISHDGRLVAFSNRFHKTLYLWNVQEKTLIGLLHDHDVGPFAFSSTDRLASSHSHITADTDIRFWDVSNGNLKFKLHNHGNQATCLQFSPDGKTIVSSELLYGKVRVWDVETKMEHGCLGLSASQLGGIALSADGKFLAAIVVGQIRIWEMATGKEFPAAKTPGHYSYQIALSFDGTFLAAIDFDKKLKVWNRLTGELQIGPDQCNLPPGSRAKPCFSPDARFFAVKGKNEIEIWDLRKREKCQKIPCNPDGATAICFAPDSATLMHMQEGKDKNLTLTRWDVPNKNKLGVQPLDAPPIGKVAMGETVFEFSLDGKHLAGNVSLGVGIRIWNTASGKMLPQILGRDYLRQEITFSPDGSRIASHPGIAIWNVSTGDEIQIRGGTGRPWDIDSTLLSLDGRLLIVAHNQSPSGPGWISLWDLDPQ